MKKKKKRYQQGFLNTMLETETLYFWDGKQEKDRQKDGRRGEDRQKDRKRGEDKEKNKIFWTIGLNTFVYIGTLSYKITQLN